MADDLEYGIEVTAKESGVKETATAISNLTDTFGDLQKGVNQTLRGLGNIEKALAGVTKNTKDLASANERAAKTQAATATDPFKATRELVKFGADPAFAQTRATLGIDLEAQAALKAEKEKLTVLKEQLQARKALREAARTEQVTGTGIGSAEDVAKRFISSGYLMRQEAAEQAAAVKKVRDENIAAAQGAMEHANRLTNLRYSLYDVRNTALITTAALAGINIVTVKAAMDYETAMAQISRTSGATGQELENIRNQFIDLAQTIPTAFGDLAEIGTLGGQLNIPSNQLADFTETVAKFTATTNVAVDDSATAFGRLDALLDDVNGNYEALGSSILTVGINSVATETEIIATTNQITAAAQQAGFAAKEIIGLAASFASLGVAPEAARGTTIRVLSTINTAVAEGNDNLQALAKFAKMSASEFKDAWGSDAAGTFQAVLDGMQAASESGQNLETVIRSMGITAVRDINALLKLAQNADIVGSNFAYAAQGFDDATALGSAFEIQAATLASKLQVLANSFQALLATLGESGLGPIGAFVDLLNGILKWVTELAQSPFVQWLTIVVGFGTALAAFGTLGVAALSSMGTSAIAAAQAFTTLRVELLALTGGATGARAAFMGLTGAMTSGTGAAVGLRVALLGLAATTAIGLGFAAVATLVTEIANATKSAGDKAKEAFGDLSGLSQALQADTEAAANGAKVYGEIAGTITTATTTTADWAVELEKATGSQNIAGEAATVTTEKVKAQTFAIGENTAAWIANKLATDEQVQKLFELNAEIAKTGGPTLDTQGFIAASVANDTEKARAIVQQWLVDYKAYMAEGGQSTDGATLGVNQLTGAIETLVTGALQEASNATQVQTAVNEALGVSSEDAALKARYGADALDEYGGAADGAADATSALRAAIDAAFSTDNALAAMVNDVYSLAEGVYEGGNAFNYLSQAGLTNLGNLQNAVATTILAGQSLGVGTADSVAALFITLQNMGIDTANLMARVARASGVSVASIQGAMNAPNAAVQKMAGYLGSVTKNAQAAAAAVGSKRGGGGGGGGIGNAAKEAQKEVRTLVDYSKDLAEVWNRAYSIRFDTGSSLDNITSAWRTIANATAEANRNIQSIQAELQQIGSDRSTYEYFLGVAEAYGDQLRAADIRAKLAQLDADQAEATAKLKTEQDKTNRSLEGNSDAAIANRKTVLDLVKQYESLIGTYAASGMDAGALQLKTAQLKQEFMAQATQLGYNSAELEKYAAGFDDVALAVQRVPRNVTVTANINPALQALNEFEAKAAQSASNAANSIRSGGGGGYSMSAPTLPDFANLGNQAALQYKRGWNTQTQTWQTRDATTGAWVRTNVNLYKEGGFTGMGASSAIAGLVHGKEFVVNAENTAKFRPILEAMNRGQMPAMAMPVPGMGAGTQVVELSAYDRQLLAAAGNVQLNIDGRAVADASNRANFVSANRGSN